MGCIVVIPIYKSTPSILEMESFQQCFAVLRNYKISIVTYEGLDLSLYLCRTEGKDVSITYFEKSFFRSVEGYSQLLMSHKFYQTFTQFEYILIYQLDAWVFSDQLSFWCSLNYDYIGAPWFEYYGSYEEGKQLWKVGNGGVSLRKVKRFLKLTSPDTLLRTRKDLILSSFRNLLDLPKNFLKLFGYHNTIRYYRELMKNDSLTQEDTYFCVCLSEFSNCRISSPEPIEAIGFCIERSPAYLFSKIKKLPFAVHAWKRYNPEFWEPYIFETKRFSNC